MGKDLGCSKILLKGLPDKKTAEDDMISVYYDGLCGVCSKEIRYYQGIANPDDFDWVDVTENEERLDALGVSLPEALKALHATDADGRLHVGVDAFVLIWKQLPRWRTLAFLVSLPIIHSLATFLYKHFANWRFQRLTHCQIAASKER